MLILGINGGFDAPGDEALDPTAVFHDASAVLLEDGAVVAAVEQERLDRIKHSRKFPARAIRFCLEQRGVSLADVDRVAYYFTENSADQVLQWAALDRNLAGRPLAHTGVRALLGATLEQAFGVRVPPERFEFVRHHLAHAESAYAMSGFDRALVLTLDGVGDLDSGMVLLGDAGKLELLRVIPPPRSVGAFYLGVIRFLGYHLFDEYKVMGLAPYGDPSVHRALFESFYDLLPRGEFVIHETFRKLYEVLQPRRRGEPFTQLHKDLAAALQEALEKIVLHCVRHFREATGATRLCFAGGVAHNCTLNGRLLASGMFEDVFVQPAAHDAGCALGAALTAHRRAETGRPAAKLTHLYWGPDACAGGDGAVREALARWGEWVSFERSSDVCSETAGMLAAGEVLGWVQGRSEFGPRALGNRSILADPRPASHKDTINAMVKKREGYRPFAPSVPEEDAGAWFELPGDATRLPYMVFVVPVRPEKRAVLGAVTHVDGTARVQTVSRADNPRYWSLLREFGARTGVPVLLNTSFNNNAEPIVESVDDAVVCFLTTGLHALVVGDYVVRKRAPAPAPGMLLRLVPALPAHVRLVETFAPGAGESRELRSTGDPRARAAASARAMAVLRRADGRRSLGELVREVDGVEGANGADEAAVEREFWDLWSGRWVALRPAG